VTTLRVLGNQVACMDHAALLTCEHRGTKAGVEEPHSPGLTVPAAGPPSFDSLYEVHFDFVWRTVRRLGVEGTAAADVVQEVFFAVHRKLAEFEGRSSLKTWVFSIVLQFVRHYRRTRDRKDLNYHGRDGACDPDTLADAVQPGPIESAEKADAVRLLDQLLQELDDEKREVFVLAEVEQMTANEIAEVISVSTNTVYSRLRAARKEFDQALSRHRAREARRYPCGI
jgi:RNA polymerase sigma-70 factor (ECF subfamily)